MFPQMLFYGFIVTCLLHSEAPDQAGVFPDVTQKRWWSDAKLEPFLHSHLTTRVQSIHGVHQVQARLAPARSRTRAAIKLGMKRRQQTPNKDQNTGSMRSDKIQLNLITRAVVSF